MKSGDIVLVDFQGAREIKRRPAVVVSTDTYHLVRPDMILGVIATRIDSADTATDYVLQDWQEAGLKRISAFRSYFGTYERSNVSKVIGQLSNLDWNEIQKRLRIAIAVTD